MTLTRWERQWAVAIWDTIFPRGADVRLPMGIRDLDTEGFLTDMEGNMPGRWLLGFRLAVVLVALAPVIALGRFATVAGLRPDERVQLLDRLGRSPFYLIRQLGILMKMTGALLYCGAREVRSVLARPAPAVRPSMVPVLVPAVRLARRRLHAVV